LRENSELILARAAGHKEMADALTQCLAP
jgi:hypothetical protein